MKIRLPHVVCVSATLIVAGASLLVALGCQAAPKQSPRTVTLGFDPRYMMEWAITQNPEAKRPPGIPDEDK